MADSTPRLVYHTLYYVTLADNNHDAIAEFITKLEELGYNLDFIQSMQFTAFPKSGITNRIAMSAQYQE